MDEFEIVVANRDGVTVRHKDQGHEMIYRFVEDGGGRRVLQRRPDEAPDATPEVLEAGARAAKTEAERLDLFNP